MLSRKSNEKLTASFDFDETTTLPEYDHRSRTWKRTLNPNWAVIAEMCRLKYEGWRIYLITERKKSPINLREVREFLESAQPPIDEVFYTSGYEKYVLLPGIRSTLHYDDDRYELERLPPSITGVKVNTRIGPARELKCSGWT